MARLYKTAVRSFSKSVFYLTDSACRISNSRGIEKIADSLELFVKFVDPKSYWTHEARKKRLIPVIDPLKKTKDIFGNVSREEVRELLRQD